MGDSYDLTVQMRDSAASLVAYRYGLDCGIFSRDGTGNPVFGVGLLFSQIRPVVEVVLYGGLQILWHATCHRIVGAFFAWLLAYV